MLNENEFVDKSKKVMVIYGGISSEREVSLRSGLAVYNALKEFGYTNLVLFDLHQDNIGEVLQQKPDVVYLALHGIGGEDGCIQGVLQLAGIPYTGPGVAASAICMNKILTKRILKSTGIPTPKYVIVTKSDNKSTTETIDMLISEIGFPMVLKSPSQGSSIGVVLVKTADKMAEAIEEVYKYGDELLAEEYLSGTELTLPIIGNDELTVLPEVEITSEREFYDYKSKYTNGLCHHIIPARISDEEREKVKEIGIKAYKVLNCCGISRIDFIVDKVKGPMIIEVNTLPGMTEMSLVPDSARTTGLSFGQLVSDILNFGVECERI